MAKRVSQSLLDPWFSTPLKSSLYPRLNLPAWFPPEGIIAVGHLWAIVGAVGFALAGDFWWGGLLAAVGVAMNHVSDVLDGTHARTTGQCRNGGELLDHFADPLSFCYWIVGIAVCAEFLPLGIAGVLVIYATALLTNIKAKMSGTFELATFGPTEFKSLLILFGVSLTVIVGGTELSNARAASWALVFLSALLVVGVIQLVSGLYRTVREVNALPPADTEEWELARSTRLADSQNPK